MINVSHPLDFEIAMKIIRKGTTKAGRYIGAYTACSIAKSRDEAISGATKIIVAYIVAGSPLRPDKINAIRMIGQHVIPHSQE